MNPRAIIAAILLALVGTLGLASPASASEGVVFNKNKSWTNCDTFKTKVKALGKFEAWRYGGAGTYYVKWKAEWQAPKVGGGWKTFDSPSGTGKKWSVRAGSGYATATISDKTNWGGSLYYAEWRVKIRITLYKAVAGPDVRYLRDRITKTFAYPRFDERGGFCGQHGA
ncbi:MAG: hypothetical protein KDB63_22520 [Nocardioidaceae bacterium]|nr:hypothetical protein [Nocardioidaceae bacterium]